MTGARIECAEALANGQHPTTTCPRRRDAYMRVRSVNTMLRAGQLVDLTFEDVDPHHRAARSVPESALAQGHLELESQLNHRRSFHPRGFAY
jgi:hypothetical protein